MLATKSKNYLKKQNYYIDKTRGMEPLDYIKKKFDHSNETNKSHTGYDVPVDYFKSLESKILAQTVEKVAVDRPVRRLAIPWKFAAIAASLAIVVWSVAFLNSEDILAEQFSMNEMSQEDSYNLLMEDEMDLELEDLLEMEGIDEILDELEQELIVKK